MCQPVSSAIISLRMIGSFACAEEILCHATSNNWFPIFFSSARSCTTTVVSWSSSGLLFQIGINWMHNASFFYITLVRALSPPAHSTRMQVWCCVRLANNNKTSFTSNIDEMMHCAVQFVWYKWKQRKQHFLDDSIHTILLDQQANKCSLFTIKP